MKQPLGKMKNRATVTVFQDNKPILQTSLPGLGAGFNFEQDMVDYSVTFFKRLHVWH